MGVDEDSLDCFDFLSPEDTTVTETHFDNALTVSEKGINEIRKYLLERGIDVKTLVESQYGDLETLVQEIDENPPPNILIERVDNFKSINMVPLLLYPNKEGNEIYIAVQGEQREENLSIERTNKRGTGNIVPQLRKTKYSSSDNRDIATEIECHITDSPLLKYLKEKRHHPKFVLVSVKDFDSLENYLKDPKSRKDFLGQIDEADTGEKTMWKIFERAVQLGATDVHIEALDERTGVARYRVDGYLEPEKLPRSRVRHIVSAIKVKTKMPIEERRKALEGGTSITEANFRLEELAAHPTLRGYTLRVETLPSIH